MTWRVVLGGLGALVLVLAGCARATPAEVAKLAEGKFRLTLRTVNVADAAQGQRQLLPQARRLCGDAPVRLGHYTFEASGDAESRRTPSEPRELVQEISCGPAGAATSRHAASTQPAKTP